MNQSVEETTKERENIVVEMEQRRENRNILSIAVNGKEKRKKSWAKMIRLAHEKVTIRSKMKEIRLHALRL